MVPVLLFPGMPGSTELLVILVMMGLVFVAPFGLIVAAYKVGKRRGRTEAEERAESQ